MGWIPFWTRRRHNVEIEEAYRDYTPEVDVVEAVSRLLNGIPPMYLRGLRCVTLTNSKGRNLARRRHRVEWGGRAISIWEETCGLYHALSRDEEAYIELFVDNILRVDPGANAIMGSFSSFLKWVDNAVRATHLTLDFKLSTVLYHEIGHHIRETQTFQHKECENLASAWTGRLMRHYLYRRYWYLFPYVWLAVAGHTMSVANTQRDDDI
jgi:hypothetical protein